MGRPLSVFWRVFAVNAGLLGVLAALLLFSPVTISAPIRPTQALIVVAALVITLAANALLLRRALAPLERLAQRMEMVDLLRPGQRLQVIRNDEISRVVVAFNRMLDRLESERQQSGRRVLAAQEAERVGIAPIDGSGDDAGSVTIKNNREGAARVVARLAAEYGVADTAERRSSIGDPAALVGQIAAEEAADLIVVGARLRGRLRRGLESRLAEQLDSETSVPILIAPPRTRRAGKMVA